VDDKYCQSYGYSHKSPSDHHLGLLMQNDIHEEGNDNDETNLSCNANVFVRTILEGQFILVLPPPEW
jgi:hypothetical protein